LFLVVGTSAINYLERLISNMTYYVLSGTLNPTLTHPPYYFSLLKLCLITIMYNDDVVGEFAVSAGCGSCWRSFLQDHIGGVARMSAACDCHQATWSVSLIASSSTSHLHRHIGNYTVFQKIWTFCYFIICFL